MGKARGTKVVSHAAKQQREAMVRSLERIIAREYQGMAPNTAYKRIERATGVSLSTMQRIMSGETGPSIDTLADLARHLGATVPEILGYLPFRKAPTTHEPNETIGSSRTSTY
jgi:transcriptional regulator with XRE-family HTH domain